ncbi:MAG TPA: tetratricopeptide repeat protein [Chitinophagaceae bacterium]|nr:tetratricopeptide repeat protein [Chitinophagaceae bacterium]
MKSGIPSLRAFAFAILIFLLGNTSCRNSGNPAKENINFTPPKIISVEADSLRRLIAENPDSAIYRQQLILQLEQDNQVEEALKQNDTLLQQIGNVAIVWLNRAILLEEKNDTSGATQALEKALTIQNPYPEVQLRLAKLYAESKNPKALQIVDFMFKNEQAFGLEKDLILIRGIYYRNTKDYDKALDCFDQAIRDNYTFMEAYIEKGCLLYDLKKYKESIIVFNKATTVNNTFADGYYWIAKNQEALNQKSEAADNYKRALALDQEFTEAKQALKNLGIIK